MDNIGEIAYLVIVALIFLAQTIFGKKKKNQQKGPQRDTKPANDPFEEIFGDFFGEEKKKEESKPYYGEEEQEEPFIHETVLENGNVVSTEQNIDTTPYSKYTQRNQLYERRTESGLDFNSPALQVEHLDEDNGIDIDLREAVIHQIILERKFKV